MPAVLHIYCRLNLFACAIRTNRPGFCSLIIKATEAKEMADAIAAYTVDATFLDTSVRCTKRLRHPLDNTLEAKFIRSTGNGLF